jgi:arylsulfatase A-like enzyme
MVEHDKIVGQVLQKIKDLGIEDNTIVICGVEPGKEWFTGFHLTRHKVVVGGQSLFIYGAHTLHGQRTGIFDLAVSGTLTPLVCTTKPTSKTTALASPGWEPMPMAWLSTIK